MVCASVAEARGRTNYTVTYAYIALSNFRVQAINLGLFKTHFWRTKMEGGI